VVVCTIVLVETDVAVAVRVIVWGGAVRVSVFVVVNVEAGRVVVWVTVLKEVAVAVRD
jgi:hypothetical protein